MKHVLMKETLGCLTLFGLWPRSQNSPKTVAYLVISSSSFLFFGCFIYLISEHKFGKSILPKKNFFNLFLLGSDYIDAIETVTSQFGVLYFCTLFTVKRDGTIKIIQLLSDFSKFGKPRFFDERNKKLTYLLNYCLVVLSLAISGVVACPQIYINSCYKYYEQLNLTRTCGLIAPVWLPFNYDQFPRKQIVLAWETYCCIVTYGCSGIIALVIIGTMEHLIIRIEQLKNMFPDILKESNKGVRKQKFENWIEYHLHLFKIGRLMNDTYRYCLSVIVILFGCIGVSTMQVSFDRCLIEISMLFVADYF